jgi:hypothetical protein
MYAPKSTLQNLNIHTLIITDVPWYLTFRAANIYKQSIFIFVRFEVFTAVTLMNVVFLDIRTQFIPHRRHIMSPLQSPAC